MKNLFRVCCITKDTEVQTHQTEFDLVSFPFIGKPILIRTRQKTFRVDSSNLFFPTDVCSSLLPFLLSNPSAQMQFTFPTCLSSRCYTPSSFIPPLFPIPFSPFFMFFVYTLLSPILPSLFSNSPFFLIFPLLTVSSSRSRSYSLKFILISSIYSLISLFFPFHLFSPILL
jgi:hypothetical protein